MTSLTVACVWVAGNVPYSAEYVVRLRAMVARQLKRPHRFVCLTDRPEQLPADLETIRIATPEGMFGWWAKIELFAAGRFTGRVLYLDLDTLIVAPLDPIVDYPAPFALIPHAGSFEPKPPHQVVRRFNSSVMTWTAGAVDELHTAWGPAVTKRFWGDQDWIGYLRSSAADLPIAWFPRLSELAGAEPPAAAIVVLAKKPKNEEAARRWPWVADIWRAA